MATAPQGNARDARPGIQHRCCRTFAPGATFKCSAPPSACSRYVTPHGATPVRNAPSPLSGLHVLQIEVGPRIYARMTRPLGRRGESRDGWERRREAAEMCSHIARRGLSHWKRLRLSQTWSPPTSNRPLIADVRALCVGFEHASA